MGPRNRGRGMKIWTFEEMWKIIQMMDREEKDRLLTMLLRDEAVMIMMKKEEEEWLQRRKRYL